MIEWLTSVSDPLHPGETFYPASSLTGFELVDLPNEGKLVLSWDKERFILKFTVLQWAMGSENGDAFYSCIFHGTGPTSRLRECRHTWWGDDGYVFYPDGNIIAAAFLELGKHFDQMV
jgi:hypothetical protein